MSNKRKVRIDRLIILILTALLLCCLLGFGIYKLFSYLFSSKENKKENANISVETVDDIKLTLNDYQIYFDENNDIGFSFIIADVDFSSNKAISFDFASLQTSEKLYLNDVNKYLNKLELAGYDINKLGIDNSSIVTEQNTINRKIFIPYTTDSYNLTVYNSINTSNSLNFDLTKDKINATTLKLDNDNEEVVVGDTSIYVSNAYISTFMLHNGEAYEISSSSKIYSFEITVNQTEDNVKIEDAIFIQNGTDEQINCKGKDYKAIDMDNIIDVNLSNGAKGGLFFEVYSNSDTVEDGILLLKFSNKQEWVEISTKQE